MDRGAWWATVHGRAKSPTHTAERLSDNNNSSKKVINVCVFFFGTLLPS